MKVYKLTNQDMQTHGGFQWALGEITNACSDEVFHVYPSPELAVLLNPIHSDFQNPRLFEAEGGGEVVADDGLKLGVKRMTLLTELPLPEVTTLQRVKFAALCEKEVRHLRDPIPTYDDWADKFLKTGVLDAEAAERAEWAAMAAAAVAEMAAAAVAEMAAAAVAEAAEWAAVAEMAAAAVAEAAEWVAVARAVAEAAEWAAAAAAAAGEARVNFKKLALEALK